LGWVPAPHTFVGVYWVRIGDAHGKGQIAKAREKVLKFATARSLLGTMKPGNHHALFPA